MMNKPGDPELWRYAFARCSRCGKTGHCKDGVCATCAYGEGPAVMPRKAHSDFFTVAQLQRARRRRTNELW